MNSQLIVNKEEYKTYLRDTIKYLKDNPEVLTIRAFHTCVVLFGDLNSFDYVDLSNDYRNIDKELGYKLFKNNRLTICRRIKTDRDRLKQARLDLLNNFEKEIDNLIIKDSYKLLDTRPIGYYFRVYIKEYNQSLTEK